MVLIFAGKFAIDGVAWTTVASSIRAAALNDEILNNAVECEAIVKSFFREGDEILYGIWCILLEEFNLHDAFFGMDLCCFHINVREFKE